jgi:purine-nucleoside phosphorylase
MIENIDLMDNRIYLNVINQNVGYIKSVMKAKNIDKKYETLVILGSGLGNIADSVKVDFEIEYSNMPYMPSSLVAGHKSKFVFGELMGKNVVMMVGRIHYYEGYSMRAVTLPVRIMKKLGVNNLIVTNASGAIKKELKIASIVAITDHINYTSLNPLIGENLEDFGERFPAMSNVYDKNIIDKVIKKAEEKNISVNSGVYLYVTGPNYETRSEIKMFKNMGADIVAMSTVPEVIVAKHSGMKVVGFSCVTDICDSEVAPSHEEVLKSSKKGSSDMLEVIKLAIEEM